MLRSPALLVPCAAVGLLAAASPDRARAAPAQYPVLVSPDLGSCGWRRGDILEASGTIQSGGLTGRFLRRAEAGSGRLFETDDLGIVVTRNGFDGAVAWTQDMSGGLHDLS